MTELLIALVTLTVLEIVLGVDNIIFISILSGKLPKAAAQARAPARPARRDGARGSCCCCRSPGSRTLTEPFVTLFGRDISGRDVILIGGGLFLLAKATYEIHDKLEGETASAATRPAALVR